MNKEQLKSEIKKTGYLENKKLGMVFNKKYPNLYNNILEITNSLNDTYYINKYFRSRVIFLIKYDSDIEKIRINNKWLSFDRKKDDFIDKTGDYVKRGWDKIKENITIEKYSKEETIDMLKADNLYLKYLGKSKNRTLLKENPKLYNSIYKHTSFMDEWHNNNKKLSSRIITLIKYDGDVNKLKCNECNINLTYFNYEIMDYKKICFSCFNNTKYKDKYPKKGWFKNKYGVDWEEYYKIFLIENSKKFAKNSFSKISQKIFWEIYENLTSEEKKECYFKELNQEYFLNTKNGFFFIDFKYKNKIIEFDGVYWHRNTKEKDDLRDLTYNQLGYEILIINENDLNKNKINKEVIEKCLNFLKNEN